MRYAGGVGGCKDVLENLRKFIKFWGGRLPLNWHMCLIKNHKLIFSRIARLLQSFNPWLFALGPKDVLPLTLILLRLSAFQVIHKVIRWCSAIKGDKADNGRWSVVSPHEGGSHSPHEGGPTHPCLRNFPSYPAHIKAKSTHLLFFGAKGFLKLVP